MEPRTKSSKIYGLIGRNIRHSFSQKYFTDKFKFLNLDSRYENFDIPDLSGFRQIIENDQNLCGLNVTIPYKEAIIPYLDALSETAQQIGAVNTVKINAEGKLTGFNTDWIGFTDSLLPLIAPHHTTALILGTGGASKAIAFALDQLDIGHEFVTSSPQKHGISYKALNENIIASHKIIINCTPLGTYPNITSHPDIPFEGFSDQHLAFDLIYNPTESAFLQKAGSHGAVKKNGYEMLVNQAERSWEIWNKHD